MRIAQASLPSRAERALRAAFRSLVTDRGWHGLLAENLYWASCEPLLQAALLHAFNNVSKGLVADRERELERKWKLDLLVFEREKHEEWWEARLGQPVDRDALAQMARALVQLKVAWTRNSVARGAARLSSKAAEILRDIAGLKRRLRRLRHCEFYWGVLIADFPDRGADSAALDEAEGFLLSQLETEHDLSAIKRLDVLADHPLEHWRPAPLVSARLLWCRVPAG